MRVAHAVPHLDDEASGPSLSVIRLCEALAAAGESVQLHAMAAARVPQGVELVLHREWALFGRFGFSLELIRALREASRSTDILHNHSLWAFPNMVAGLVTTGTRAKLVTSPRGTLARQALSRSQLKKRALRPLQWPAITRASCLHATGTNEYQDIRQLDLEHPVAIIPNGIDIPALQMASDGGSESGMRRLLFLGRLHPIKGIELLLETWQGLQDHHPTWELVIAGKGDANYIQSLCEMARALKLQRVSFPGPVYGEDKHRLYFASALFVLPTFTENFGMAIAEAQAHALPVITTWGAPWEGLNIKNSGFWVKRDAATFSAAMDQAMTLDSASLKAMGARGRQWMMADFDWSSIATQMAAVYRWLQDGGEPPACVRLD